MVLSDWNEKQLLALTAAVAGATLLVMAGLVLYIFTKYTKLEDEIGRVRRENKKLKEKADKLERKREELDNLSKVSAPDGRRLPGDDDVAGLRTQVSEQSRSAHLKVTKFNRVTERAVRRKAGKGAPQTAGKYTPVKMAIELAGKFHDFGQFIKRLEERLERIVAVTGFEITANRDGLVPEEPAVGVKLWFEAYRYKVPRPQR